MLILAKEEMNCTCWTEISSIGKLWIVLLGRGAAAYKLHRKKKSEKKWQNKNKYKSKITIKEEMKYTCWTEISSIGIFGTVLPGMGESTYKLHINLGKKSEKKWQNKYIYIYKRKVNIKV